AGDLEPLSDRAELSFLRRSGLNRPRQSRLEEQPLPEASRRRRIRVPVGRVRRNGRQRRQRPQHRPVVGRQAVVIGGGGQGGVGGRWIVAPRAPAPRADGGDPARQRRKGERQQNVMIGGRGHDDLRRWRDGAASSDQGNGGGGFYSPGFGLSRRSPAPPARRAR